MEAANIINQIISLDMAIRGKLTSDCTEVEF